MARPVFHPDTLNDLEAIASRMPHAIGLFGEKGVGLFTAAHYIAAQAKATIDVVLPEKQERIDMEEGTITIDIVRRLYRLTQGKNTTPRCIVITAADTMSHEAQNAFLKLLEEPTAKTSFILLIHNKERLLPTVLSRLQHYTIRPVTDKQSDLLLTSLGVSDEARRRQLLFIASGRPALLTRLSQNEKLFSEEAELLRQARTFVQGTQYDRLVVCHTVKDSRDKAIRLVEHAMTIIRFDILTRKSADDTVVALLSALERALERLASNANIRLALAEAAL